MTLRVCTKLDTFKTCFQYFTLLHVNNRLFIFILLELQRETESDEGRESVSLLSTQTSVTARAGLAKARSLDISLRLICE